MKVGENMDKEREEQIIEKLKDALPTMSDFDKGYILCLAEKSEKKAQLVQQ